MKTFESIETSRGVIIVTYVSDHLNKSEEEKNL